MSILQDASTAAPKSARPAPHTRHPRPTIRRCVREIETLADGKIVSNIKSLSKDDGTRYEAVIDPHTGEGRCTCPHFVFRGARCKHILRALENAARKHQLENAVADLVSRGLAVFPASDLRGPVQATDAEIEALAPPEEKE